MALSAQELRIGNYVMGGKGKPYRFELCDFSDWCNDHNSHEFGDNIHPIPLTEEWLLKFGFEKDRIMSYFKDCGEYKMKISINSFSGTIEEDSSWFISILTGYGSQPVTLVKQYVHQLQNLYFALAGEELVCKD